MPSGTESADRGDDDPSWRRFGPESPERAALVALSDHLGVRLRPRSVELAPGTSLEIEGIDEDAHYLVQIVVNRAEFTSKQRNKTLADLFKLVWLRDTRFPHARVGLVLNDITSAAFKPHSWTFVAARELKVELWVMHDGDGMTELVGSP